jgi:molybdenum cofactor cytidylyltransferase
MSNSIQNLEAFKDSQNHAVIVLASGLSQRLGQSKQLLKKNNKPLINDMSDIALETQPQNLILVIPDNHSIQNAIDPIIKQNKNVTLVVNSTVEKGMGHSLYLAIDALAKMDDNAHLTLEHVLILGVDQVLLDSQHLRFLLNGLLNTSYGVVASSYSRLTYDNHSIEIDTTQPNIYGLPIAISINLLKQWQPALQGVMQNNKVGLIINSITGQMVMLTTVL